MRLIHTRNVHQALPLALQLLDQEGIQRPSRNGPVLIGPSVTTVYTRPQERVIFHPARDANPFFHLYEALWMLAGGQDVAGPARYAKQMLQYSDDGVILHGAYGYRWRKTFLVSNIGGCDQLTAIARRLSYDPDDRRCVLQMWDTTRDLDHSGKDVPCNIIATFQRGIEGELNLTVFCRSNDIVWGAYGANAVHFSMLLEYMALWIGCSIGTYTQISVNWHGYLATLDQVKSIRPDRAGYIENPYTDGRVYPSRMFYCSLKEADQRIAALLFDVSSGFVHQRQFGDDEPFFNYAYALLEAHHAWRTGADERRFLAALEILGRWDQKNDWIVAGTEWIQRRYDKWKNEVCAK